MSNVECRHILGLDIVRFVAAMMVMIFHYGYKSRFPIPYAWTGWVGVEIFFVLSGFVISYSAENVTATQFFRHRAIRLMPTIWICGTISALCGLLAGFSANLGTRYLATLFLWPTGPWVDGAYWTLPVEIAFYALVGVTLVRWRLFTLRVLIQAMSVASGTYWMLRLALQFWPNILLIKWINNISATAATFTMLQFGSYFALGGLFWLCLRRGITGWRLALIGLSLLGSVIQILFTASFWADGGETGWLPHGQHLLPILIWIVMTGAILVSVTGNRLAWRLFGRWSKPIRLIGLATYPLYLLHDNIGTAMSGGVGWNAEWVVMAFMIAVSLAISAWVEPPVQNLLRAKLQPPKQKKITGRA